MLNREQAAHHQAGTDEQHDGQGDLGYHEAGAQLAVTGGRVDALAGVLQAIVQVATNRVQSGRQSAQQGRGHGHADREEQYARIQRDDRL